MIRLHQGYGVTGYADVTDQKTDLSNTNEHGSTQIKNAEFMKSCRVP